MATDSFEQNDTDLAPKWYHMRMQANILFFLFRTGVDKKGKIFYSIKRWFRDVRVNKSVLLLKRS